CARAPPLCSRRATCARWRLADNRPLRNEQTAESMNNAERGPAIALFARSPALGEVKTRLAASIGNQRALDLYLAFVEDSLMKLADLAKLADLDEKPLGRYLYLTSE